MSNGFLGGTRARIKVATPAKVFAGVGRGLVGVGIATDIHSAFGLPDGDPNKISVGKAGLNTAVGIGSVFGGPIGATIGATYGLIDYQWNGDWGQFFRDSADGWASILGRNSAKPCDSKGSKK